MKTKLLIIVLLIMTISYKAFSQACALSSTELITDGSFESGGYTAFTSPVAGGCKEVTDNAQHTGPGCGFGGFQSTANTPQSGSYAFLYDGGSAAGQLICQTITLDRTKTYDISAFYKSAANTSTAIGNVSNLRITVNIGSGPVAIGAGWAPISNQASYLKNECFYSAGGGSGTVSATVCIEFQPTINTGGGGSYSSGNDALIDNFSVREIPSPAGGCTAGSCTYPITAPIKLILFIAERTGENEARLQWTTSSEIDFDYYSVEKSEDGLNFSEIGKIAGKGGANTLTSYEFQDSHYNRSCYYRLKSIDLDGKYEYSGILSIQRTDNDQCWIVSTEEELIVKASASESANWNIVGYTLLGQEIFNQNVLLSKGENNVPLKNIDKSPKIIRVINQDGKVIYSEVIIK